MSFPFNAIQGLVLVEVEIEGPAGQGGLSLALDTGATFTAVNLRALVALGYDPAATPQRVLTTTASGITLVPRLEVSRITALGQAKNSFPVLCLTLPPTAGIDGVLGLDFFRGHVLTVDFRQGQITLA
jgi:hypothetical protein